MTLKEIGARTDHQVKIHVAPGHFATNHSHISYYVDMTEVKSRQRMAKRAADALAYKYRSTPIDTIVCLEGTEVIGAFMAEELSQPGHMDVNSGADICVLAPELNSNNQMIFRANTKEMVVGKSVLLMIATASTGKTINRALDCLSYYGGRLTGICAVFSAIHTAYGVPVHSVFTEEDIPGYRTYLPAECEMCGKRQRIDALVNSYGFSEL